MLNVKKIKVMTSEHFQKFEVDVETIEIAKEINFLGASINTDTDCRRLEEE